MPHFRQTDAVATNMLIDIIRHRVGVCTVEHATRIAEQAAVHDQGTQFLFVFMSLRRVA